MGQRFKSGTIARQLGISTSLLRVWELRHGLVHPERTSGGQRLYSGEDLEVLRATRDLVATGYSVGEVSVWPRRTLLDAASELVPSASAQAPVDKTGVSEAGSAPKPVLFVVDAEARIVMASPNVEAHFAWPSGLLVGEPIFGLFLNLRALSSLLDFSAPNPVDGVRAWVWARPRSGSIFPCLVEVGRRRPTREGTSASIVVTPLASDGAEALAPELEGLGAANPRPEAPTKASARFVHEAVVAGAALARFWVYDAATGTLRLVASEGLYAFRRTSSRAVIRLAGYPYKVGSVARSAIPFLHNGLEDDRSFDHKWVRRERLESAAVLPIMVDGQLRGVTAQFFRRRLTSDDLGRIQVDARRFQVGLTRPRVPQA